jgi:hypothetical protein
MCALARCRYQCVVATAAARHDAHVSGRPAADAGTGPGRAAAEEGTPLDDPTASACWVGPRGDCFATGHLSGVVRVWGLPDSATGVLRMVQCRAARDCRQTPLLKNAGQSVWLGWDALQSCDHIQGSCWS